MRQEAAVGGLARPGEALVVVIFGCWRSEDVTNDEYWVVL